MDLDAFVAEHGNEWRRLERLSRMRRRSVAEVDEMMALYQRAGTHLSMVRSRAPDPALVAQLSRIVLAARAAVTGGPAFSWRVVVRFFTATFPLAVYQARRWWCSVLAAFVALSAGLMPYVAHHPQLQVTLVDLGFSGPIGRGNYTAGGPAPHIAAALWTHNALVAGECLAGGILLLPVAYFLAMNLLQLGSAGGAMIGSGRTAEFFGLILPHGLLELTAVFVAAGVGLRIGWAWIAPGPVMTRGRAVAQAARSAMMVALGLVVMLAVSGLIEAFVTPSPLPTVVRVALGMLVWAGFLVYVFLLGPAVARSEQSVDLDPALLDAALPAV